MLMAAGTATMIAMHDPPPGHQALRRGRASICGQVYLLTAVTWRRRVLFHDWETTASACALLHEDRLWRDSRPLCWVLMPDHLHLLVSLGESESLSKLMQRVKATTSAAARAPGDAGLARTWMRGYHDRALRREEDVVATARYVVMNPVRAGLVSRIGDYPHWNAIWV